MEWSPMQRKQHLQKHKNSMSALGTLKRAVSKDRVGSGAGKALVCNMCNSRFMLKELVSN